MATDVMRAGGVIVTFISEIGGFINRISFIIPIIAVFSLLYWVFAWDRYYRSARWKIGGRLHNYVHKKKLLGRRKEDKKGGWNQLMNEVGRH